MAEAYQARLGIDSQQPEVEDALEHLVRDGARRMLAAALEAEVTAFLGRGRYERGGEFRGYRNLWLAIEGGSATPEEIEADRIACDAGLGGSTPEDEMAVFPEFLAKIRARMAPWGVKLPDFEHPKLGRV